MSAMPAWTESLVPVDMNGAARMLGVSRRFLVDTIRDHPHYESRGRKKVFYPEHIIQLREALKCVSEALRIEGQHVDLGRRIALLERTKTDEWETRHLTADLVVRLAALVVKDDEPVFRYSDRCAVNRRIGEVCKRAGIDRRSTHSAGRHSFGTNAMNLPDAKVMVTRPLDDVSILVSCGGMTLARYLAANDISVPEFAQTIGISRQALYRYLSGARFPHRDIVSRIEAATKGQVPPSSWYEREAA